MDSNDFDNVLAELQRQINELRTQQARQPVAIAGQPIANTIPLSGFSFAKGDVLQCVAGVWSFLTSADTAPLTIGVVSASFTNSCTITLLGLRLADGAEGTVYFAPDTGGNASATPSVAGWWRAIEKQVTPNTRLVQPDYYGWMPQSVTACVTPDGGSPTPTPLELAIFSNE